MSEPVVYDFAQVKYGNGASPEVFVVVCDLTSVSVNEGAETQTRYRADCAKPGKPPRRMSRVTGSFWDVSGTGLPDHSQNAAVRGLVGRRRNYEIDVFRDDGTDEGELLGTYSGEAIMTARNLSMDRAGEGGQEITLEGQGELTFEAVPAS